MPTKIITAMEGETLRDYAKSKDGENRVAIFPEAGLSASEQAAFLLTSGDDFDEVITFSPFIISDAVAGSLMVLDSDSDVSLKLGDSISRISMKLGYPETIGGIALSVIKEAREQLESATSAEEITGLISDINHTLGDSVEKVLFVKVALEKQKAIDNDPGMSM